MIAILEHKEGYYSFFLDFVSLDDLDLLCEPPQYFLIAFVLEDFKVKQIFKEHLQLFSIEVPF